MEDIHQRNPFSPLCSGNEGIDSEPLPLHRYAKGSLTAHRGMHSRRDRYCHHLCNRQYLPMHSYSQSLGLKSEWILHRRQFSLLCKCRARHIFQGAFLYVLPMTMLSQLQVPRRQKIALMLVFAIGVITGMVRCNYVKVAQDTPDTTCKQPFLKLLEDFS